MDNKNKLFDLVNSKWDELQEKEKSDSSFNPYIVWDAFLEENGLDKVIVAEPNFQDENGVFSLIEELIDLINTENNLFVMEDPSNESTVIQYLVFSNVCS